MPVVANIPFKSLTKVKDFLKVRTCPNGGGGPLGCLGVRSTYYIEVITDFKIGQGKASKWATINSSLYRHYKNY